MPVAIAFEVDKFEVDKYVDTQSSSAVGAEDEHLAGSTVRRTSTANRICRDPPEKVFYKFLDLRYMFSGIH